MRAVKIAGIIGAGTIGVALFGGGALYLDGARARGTGAYVALGSSFASAPGVGRRAPRTPLLCAQSSENYAHLVAQQLGLALVDRSCSGSTTEDILDRRQYFQTAQITSVGPKTRLVTVTTGGNDLGYIATLFAASCANRRAEVPIAFRAVCRAKPGSSGDAQSRELAMQFDAIAAAVHRRAPQATLVFVDYATILPEKGECPERLPAFAASLTRARAVAATLNKIIADAATRNGARLVGASELTRDHGICAREPWAFEWTFPASPLNFGPLAYHPKAPAMRAIASAITKQIGRSLTEK
jgi:lysophospholipase L1-like esterase